MKQAMHMFRAICAALFVAGALALAAPAPGHAQGQVNPTAQSVKEDDLLKALQQGGTVSGRVSIPDQKSANLIQPAGRDWRSFHQGTLPTIGLVSIIGMLVLLVLFYAIRGRIRIDSGWAGRTITRFPTFDRFVHWMTASCFIVLALSGLNLTFGRGLIEPAFGPAAFATMTVWGKIAHNYLAFPFMAGVALMFVIWVKDNIPGKVDLEWIKQGGGLFVKGKHPPAHRFNAGQKGIFWIVMIGGAIMSLSGWNLLFPFTDGHNVTDQQFFATIHGVLAMVFIAVMLAHAYIGSVGMEGAFDAMGSGEVDENWAREHHPLWVAEEKAKTPPHALPAE